MWSFVLEIGRESPVECARSTRILILRLGHCLVRLAGVVSSFRTKDVLSSLKARQPANVISTSPGNGLCILHFTFHS